MLRKLHGLIPGIERLISANHPHEWLEGKQPPPWIFRKTSGKVTLIKERIHLVSILEILFWVECKKNEGT